MSISSFLMNEHRSCDHLLVEVENAATEERWDDARAALGQFRAALDAHLSMEESVLFPTLEEAAGGPFGPTVVMRAEHGQMRQLLTAAEGHLAIAARRELLGAVDTLMTLIAQHNMKEERILYPMADRSVADGPALIARMESVRPTAA